MASNTNESLNNQDAVTVDTSTTSDRAKPAKRLKLSNLATEASDGGKSKNDSSPVMPSQSEIDNVTVCASEAEDNPKKKRHWESWDMVDKDVFFEGLAEFGKDFDKIKNYMKNKRREEAKNKEQIRHFYYRTWNKIAKSLPVESDKDKKGQHELFCLLCYGELRKKGVRGFGTSQMKKLDELIKDGLTVLRYKGRRCKVKPPNCKALKRIQEQQLDRSTGIVIPKKINVELSPRTTSAWCIARKLCCNPRLRCTGIPTKLWMVQLFLLLERKMKCYHAQYSAAVPSNPLHIFASSSAAEVQKSHADNAPKSPKVLVFDSRGSLDVRLNETQVSAEKEEIERNEPTIDRIEEIFPQTIPPTEETNNLPKTEATVETQREVWTKEDCAVTIATLYSDLGKQENLELFYDWPSECEPCSELPQSLKCLSHLAKCELQASLTKQPVRKKLPAAANAQNVDPNALIPISSKHALPLPLRPKHAFIVPSIPQDRLTLVNSCNNVKSSPTTLDLLNFPKAHKRGRAPRNTITTNVVKRTIIPRPVASKKLIPSAVAVNIVQQPAQLVQFPDIPHEAQAQEPQDEIQVTNADVTSSIPNETSTVDNVTQHVSFAGLISQSVSVQVVDEGHAPAAELNTKTSQSLSTIVSEATAVSSGQPTTATAQTLLSDIDLSFLQNLPMAESKRPPSTTENVNDSQPVIPVHETSNDSVRTPSILTTPLKTMLETPTKIFEGSSSGSKSSPPKIPSLNLDQQWGGGEMSDVSLSSLLGGFGADSSKVHQVVHGATAGLDFIFDDTSVDYINRFREMAAKATTNCASGNKQANDNGIITKTPNCVSNTLLMNSARAVQGSDARLPICHSEDSSGPLDGLSFVLPSNDNNPT